jgi:uncharacterized membrane-anchored protein
MVARVVGVITLFLALVMIGVVMYWIPHFVYFFYKVYEIPM